MTEILILIVGLVLVGGTLALVLYPLWRQTPAAVTPGLDRPGRSLEEYEARYQVTLAAIRDLMFDYEMGKVSAEDYEVLLQKSKLEAAQIRRQIDQLRQQGREIDPTIDAEIETLVAQLKEDRLNGSDSLGREVEAEIESLKEIRLDESGGLTCPKCGRTAQVGDAFCSGCGQSLAGAKAICPNCGAAIEADDAFCAKCGTTLDKDLTTRNQPVSEMADIE
jgi:hypothetical protein